MVMSTELCVQAVGLTAPKPRNSQIYQREGVFRFSQSFVPASAFEKW